MATTANFNVLNVYTWRSFDVISAYTCVRIGIKMFVVRSHSQTVAKSGVWRCLFRSTHATLSCRCDSCVCVRLCECDETPTQALLQWNKQLQTWKKCIQNTILSLFARCIQHSTSLSDYVVRFFSRRNNVCMSLAPKHVQCNDAIMFLLHSVRIEIGGKLWARMKWLHLPICSFSLLHFPAVVSVRK